MFNFFLYFISAIELDKGHPCYYQLKQATTGLPPIVIEQFYEKQLRKAEEKELREEYRQDLRADREYDLAKDSLSTERTKARWSAGADIAKSVAQTTTAVVSAVNPMAGSGLTEMGKAVFGSGGNNQNQVNYSQTQMTEHEQNQDDIGYQDYSCEENQDGDYQDYECAENTSESENSSNPFENINGNLDNVQDKINTVKEGLGILSDAANFINKIKK